MSKLMTQALSSVLQRQIHCTEGSYLKTLPKRDEKACCHCFSFLYSNEYNDTHQSVTGAYSNHQQNNDCEKQQF